MASAPRTLAILGTRGYPSYYGGFETAIRKIAPYLADAGWQVTVYGRDGESLEPNHGDPRVRSLTTRGVETRSLSTLSFGLTAAIDAVRRRPRVALVMNVANGFWLPLLRLRGIRTVVNVDGIEWHRAKWGRLAKAVFWLGAWVTAKSADTLIFDSTNIASYWYRHFKRTGEFIPYGADVMGDLPIEDGLTDGGYVLYVARFVPENTFGEFLSAAEQLSGRWPVVIVGSSGYRDEHDAQVTALVERSGGRITWLGHVHDDVRLASLWQHAGAYFHGHSVGGTNPALVQAMASGTPVVARDTVYNREVLAEAGVFCAADSASIVEAVARLMSSRNEAAALSDAARVRAASEYSWDIVCRRYLSCIES